MAGTDKTQKFEYRPSPAVILCEPQLGENIGTTARAMANFGLWDLRLVNPRDGWPNEKAVAAASRADHVIEKVRVFPTTEAAIEDLSLVYATTARRRDLQKPVLGPEEASQRVIAHIDTGAKAGILFGRERWGLYNEEVALSDAIVTLPVEAAFASLNIAQAVLIIAYEWRRQTDLGNKLLFTETVADGASGFLYRDPREDGGAHFAEILDAILAGRPRPDPRVAAKDHLAQFSHDALVGRARRVIEALSALE